MTQVCYRYIVAVMAEEYQSISCMNCGVEAENHSGTTDKQWARVERGALAFVPADGNETAAESAERENIKFSNYICPKCFFEDPDLCAFFNKCGFRVR